MELTSDSYREEFIKMRSGLQRKVKKAEFDQRDDIVIDCYNDICLEAVSGNVIAQDYLAYIYKKGLYNIIPENYEKYMQWQILAGANGNQFAIDKLALFLNYPLSEISYSDDFSYIANRNNLTRENYHYLVGRLLCEAIVDELRIDAVSLIKCPLEHIPYNAKTLRVFDKARSFAIPKISNYLRS